MSPTDGLPTVAIVGRPNVGKSTLFNRFVGRKLAVVHDEAGVTRDRNYARVSVEGRAFWIVDTGGLHVGDTDSMATLVRRQVEFAIDEADVLLFLVDATVGLTTDDDEIVKRLTRLAKPVLVVANKADDDRQELEAHGLVAAGLGAALPIAALTGRGVEELFEATVATLPPIVPRPAGDDDVVRVAIVGRPNVGKSSLVNAILREEKMIVSDVPGTTRDAIDTPLERDGQRFLLIDTAGLRKRRRRQDGVEYWSALRSVRAIERCDVAAVVLDATQPIGEQDVKVAAEAVEMGKSVVLVVNKWDAVEKDPDIARRFEDRREWYFTFVPDAPLVYASALTGRRADRLLLEAARLAELRSRRVTTSRLNELLAQLIAETPPPNGRSGRLTKVLYGTQVETRPPTIAVFTNRPELVEGAYSRYLRNRLCEELELKGSGLKIVVRKREGKPEADGTPRTARAAGPGGKGPPGGPGRSGRSGAPRGAKGAGQRGRPARPTTKTGTEPAGGEGQAVPVKGGSPRKGGVPRGKKSGAPRGKGAPAKRTGAPRGKKSGGAKKKSGAAPGKKGGGPAKQGGAPRKKGGGGRSGRKGPRPARPRGSAAA